MSWGHVCSCRAKHDTATGECHNYSADQELGGVCASCERDWHRPCTELLFSEDWPYPYGTCERCNWHSNSHV